MLPTSLEAFRVENCTCTTGKQGRHDNKKKTSETVNRTVQRWHNRQRQDFRSLALKFWILFLVLFHLLTKNLKLLIGHVFTASIKKWLVLRRCPNKLPKLALVPRGAPCSHNKSEWYRVLPLKCSHQKPHKAPPPWDAVCAAGLEATKVCQFFFMAQEFLRAKAVQFWALPNTRQVTPDPSPPAQEESTGFD